MMKLNLTPATQPQKIIMAYLEQSASEVLADKINFGVEIVKDGKTLVNKKTLDGFMRYANSEARKIAEKGANYACVDDATVFGWAIHYFEEDSIIEKLYNEDGTEYAPPKKSAPKKAEKKAEPKPEVKKPEPKPEPKVIPIRPSSKKPIVKNQLSLEDIFGM